MNAKFVIRLAKKAEDSALRDVLRKTWMPGDISVAFHREPCFFTAEKAGNITSQILVYKDEETGRVVGFGGRSFRHVYIDRIRKKIGYLGMLRILREYRGGTALARGYKHLHRLHSDGEVPFYFTTILSDNLQAQALLESGRAGLPAYVPVGTMVTYLIPIRKKRNLQESDIRVVACDKDLLLPSRECLEKWNSRYQLAPSYNLDDLVGNSDLLPAFSARDLYVFRDGNEVMGTLGVWDQQSFKQTVVMGYSAKVKVARYLYNLAARLRCRPTLPSIGGEIKSVYAAFISSKDDNLEVFESLLVRALSEWSGKGHDYLLVGFCEGNKLERVAARFASRRLESKVYLVHWLEDNTILPKDLRSLHLEIATL